MSPDTDEADGQDETLVPVVRGIVRGWLIRTSDLCMRFFLPRAGQDYQTAGMIVDDEIFDILVRPLPKGVRLTAIMVSECV